MNNDTFGIIGMKERVVNLEGDISIQSMPAKGTTITIQIPLLDWPCVKLEKEVYIAKISFPVKVIENRYYIAV